MKEIMQVEAAECGIACVAMIAVHHGFRAEMAWFRHEFRASTRGASLIDLMQYGSRVGLVGKAMQLDMEALGTLRLPCVLHWDMTHFVVLARLGRNTAEIFNPVEGRREIELAELSAHFTGVALELVPAPNFQKVLLEDRTFGVKTIVSQTSGAGRPVAVILVLALVLELLGLVTPMFIQWVVDGVLAAKDVDLLSVLCSAYFVLLVVRSITHFFRGLAVIQLAKELFLQWSTNVFDHLLKLPVDFFWKRHLGDIVSRFNSLDAIQRALTNSVLEAVLDGIMVVLAVGLMLWYSPMLTVFVLATSGTYAALRLIRFRRLRRLQEATLFNAARTNTNFLETVRGILPIKLYQREAERLSHWQRLFSTHMGYTVLLEGNTLFFSTASMFLIGLKDVSILGIGGYAVLNGDMSLGMLLAFSAIATTFALRASTALDKFMDMRMLNLYAERLGDIVDAKPEKIAALDGLGISNSEAPPVVAFDNVTYAYADNDPEIVQHLSFVVAAGEFVALVGPSGCGKTTVMKVILGLCLPTTGNVRINSSSLCSYGIGRLRSISGTVMQDDILFSGTIAANISFFVHAPDMEQVVACAIASCIHDDIVKMPLGYYTQIGDVGSSISGGQRQRILLARALYGKPLLLLLDEATSHLDVGTERAVLQSLKLLPMTIIAIAHRPDAIAAVDRTISIPYCSSGKVTQIDAARAQFAQN